MAGIYLVAAFFFAVLAVGFIIIASVFPEKVWLYVALSMLSFVKVALNFLAFRRTGTSVRSSTLLLSHEWKVLALGCVLSALLFIVSSFSGEGVFGLVGAPIYVGLAAVFWLAGKHAASAAV